MANTQKTTPATQSCATARDLSRSIPAAARGTNQENQSDQLNSMHAKASDRGGNRGGDYEDDDDAPIGRRARRPSEKQQALIDEALADEARQATKTAKVAKTARALQRAAGVLDSEDDDDRPAPRADTNLSFRPVPSRPAAVKQKQVLIERSSKVPRPPQHQTNIDDGRRNYGEEYRQMSQHHADPGHDGRGSSSTLSRGRRESTPPSWRRLPAPAPEPQRPTFRGMDPSPPPARSSSPILRDMANGRRVPNHVTLNLRHTPTDTRPSLPAPRRSPSPRPARSASPQTGEKRRDPPLPRLDLRVMQAQRLNNGGRAKAKDYDDTTQEALGLAILFFRVFVLVRCAFPDPKQELEWVRESWRIACERLGVTMELTPALSKLITTRDSHVRGELKTKARPIAELLFDFSSGESKEAIKRNRQIAESLKEDNALFFRDPSTRTGIFRNRAIQKLVNAAIFPNRRAPGATLPDYFDPLPLVTLALVLTVFDNCVDEWATGIRTDIPFTASEYREVYQRHVSTLEEFAVATKKYGILDKILQDLHDNGRAHSGAEPRATMSRGALLPSDIAAAMKEFEDAQMSGDEDHEGDDEDRGGDDEDNEMRAEDDEDEDAEMLAGDEEDDE
ncbi:hypothetical protein FB45DRAFT_865486 [Roridomyces roridus]|uniref:DUF6532 domain-containing protein n=1 Tax=Roridomyces roridus TaxID=1738132 RepID=A0AAD7BZE5_9AGAR|nr:hypothetical protein FB45DRAFT_865486 [Roridomyces roridus]